MKRIIAIFVSLVLLFSLCACKKETREVKKSLPFDTATIEIGNTHTDFDGVNIEIKNAVWDDDTVKLEVNWINNTKYEVTYGNPYAIELKREGEWISRQKLNNLAFTMPAFALKSGETKGKEYDLTNSFDITENGRYRIKTDCSVYNKGRGGEATKCTLWAEFTVTRKGDEGKNAKTYIGFEAQYIRTNSLADISGYPVCSVLKSKEDLNSYYNSNKNRFDLEGFLDTADKYNADFFNKKGLILIVLEEGSGSIQHNVNNITLDDKGGFYVDISSVTPEVGTCDMAQWHIVIEIAKKHIPNTADNVVVYKDGRKITAEKPHAHQTAEDEQTVSEPVVGYCGNTQTTIYFDDNKSYTFMSGNSVTMTDILLNLNYDKNKLCKCLPEYTVDTEFGLGYGINLTSGYARCDKGQADLTDEQVKRLKEIILWAKDKAGIKSKKASDFEFSLTWGTYGISSYDSETGVLIKSSDATNPKDYTTNLKLTEQQYSKIWKLIKGLDIEKYPDKYNPHGNGVSTPYMTLSLSVKSKEINKTVTAKETVISYETKNKKGQKFLDVCKNIEDILTQTEEWKALPEYEKFYD